jgi:phage-related tail protein
MTTENGVSPAVPTDAPATTTATTTPTGQVPTATTSPTDAAKTVDISELPASWQDHIKSLRKENETNRKTEEARVAAQKADTEQRLKEQEKWQELATTKEQEVMRLKPLESEVKDLTDMLMKNFNAEIAKWPEEVKATAPKGEVTAKVMGEWLESHRPLAEKLMQTTAQKPTVRQGNSSGPDPASSGNRPTGASDEPLLNVGARL